MKKLFIMLLLLCVQYSGAAIVTLPQEQIIKDNLKTIHQGFFDEKTNFSKRFANVQIDSRQVPCLVLSAIDELVHHLRISGIDAHSVAIRQHTLLNSQIQIWQALLGDYPNELRKLYAQYYLEMLTEKQSKL